MMRKCSYCAWAQIPRSCEGCRFGHLSDPEAAGPERTKKPPLGLKPRYMSDELRLREVRAAIARYMQDGWPVNPDWVAEYNHLIERHRQETEKYGIRPEPIE